MVERALAKTEAAGSKMEFEHYIQQGQQKLRCGYTTGTCAALAGKAAVRMLLGGQKTEEISVLTPKGLWVTTAVEEIQSGDGWVSCGVRKETILMSPRSP